MADNKKGPEVLQDITGDGEWSDPSSMAPLVDLISSFYDGAYGFEGFPYNGDDFRHDVILFLCRIACTEGDDPDTSVVHDIASIVGVSPEYVWKIVKIARCDSKPRLPKTFDPIVRFATDVQRSAPEDIQLKDYGKALYTLYYACGFHIVSRHTTMRSLGVYQIYLSLLRTYMDSRKCAQTGWSIEQDADGTRENTGKLVPFPGRIEDDVPEA